MRPTILLYDIDGTLISTGGAGRRAMRRAFASRFGRDEACDFRYDGMTDQAILRLALGRAGVDPDGPDYVREVELVTAAYLAALEDEAARAAADFRVHPGIARSLDLVGGRAGFAVGLGTGNFRRGAEIKLGRVDLHARFAFGGFGDDHIERPWVLRRGAERGAERLGVDLAACRVVVIGDTPKDIAAARAIGAECIAVATGNYAVEELDAHQPTHAFRSLDDPAADRAVLGA
jgi:phosphoglycolate phosphatase-like HAD superfamily hydrolase